VGAAEERSLRLYAVTQNFASAVVAYRRQLVGGTLETVERMGLSRGDYLERQVVIIAAASHRAIARVLRQRVEPPDTQYPDWSKSSP
jgi:hypothetical protein